MQSSIQLFFEVYYFGTSGILLMCKQKNILHKYADKNVLYYRGACKKCVHRNEYITETFVENAT